MEGFIINLPPSLEGGLFTCLRLLVNETA